jgi:AcrR family transcriptional regulator
MGTDSPSRSLSRARIVAAAIEILDAAGEDALTFRALSARLRTGPGAIYWHVAGKDELLAAATDTVLAGATAPGPGTPEETIRAVALGLFDAIDAHPWAGTQLSRVPSPPALLRVFEPLGQQVQALGAPAAHQFAWASALLNYILGVAGQNAANARARLPGMDRAEFLAAVAASWADLDQADYPFLRAVATQLRDHDDREQFLAGIDLILAGITGLRGS